MVNFRRPYASASISEFWSRWHISLSSWFRDYLYIPLGGNRGTPRQTARNLIIVFLVLAAQYESWSLPLAILLIVPLCVLSALTGVWMRGMDNNIFTQIGLMVLVGLACKNAILIVEFARELELDGTPLDHRDLVLADLIALG